MEGLIASGGADPLGQGLAASAAIIEKLEAAQADDDVKAIVLMVDSPGGGVNASDTICHALKAVDKPVVVIVSEPRKDLGSLYREMTEAERAYWQRIVDETHEAFVAVVAEGRDMPVEEVRPLADGSVYTGRQALDLGLLDQLGYVEDAIARAAELGGIEGEPRILEYEDRPTLLEVLTAATARTSLVPSWAEILSLMGHPTLSARWIGP